MLTVVKVGGGLSDGALPALCSTLGELGQRHPLLVVPGGGGFADAVRDADRRFRLHPPTSHRMAILGMEQFGWLLSDLIPGAGRLVLVKDVDGLFPDWPPRGEPLARLSVEELAELRAGGVDEYLPALLGGARFETWVIGGRDPARVAELLDRGTTAGTRITRARLLPSGHE